MPIWVDKRPAGSHWWRCANGMAVEMHFICDFASSWKWLHGFSPVVSSKMEAWQVRPTDGEQTLNTAAANERGSSAWHISLAEEVIAPLFSLDERAGMFIDRYPVGKHHLGLRQRQGISFN